MKFKNWFKKKNVPVNSKEKLQALINGDEIYSESFSMKADRAGWEATANFSGVAVKAFAGLAVDWFKKCQGTNYVTCELYDPDSFDRYTLTMQKAGGKTPADKIKEMRDILNRLYEEVPYDWPVELTVKVEELLKE